MTWGQWWAAVVAGIVLAAAFIALDLWWRRRERSRWTSTVVVDADAKIPVGASLRIAGVWYRVVKQDDHTVTVERL